jgi:DNA-binding NarL/FixJ family response regulator
MIRVLLADDHAVLRDGLHLLLQKDPQIEVAGDASNGCQAVEQANRLKPDLILMDISMPELNGIEATQMILKEHPEMRVIILSMQNSADYIFNALKAGASGYVLKESAGEEVLNAVHAVAEGKRFFSQPVTETLIEDYLQFRQAGQRMLPVITLSRREQEILQLVVDGHSSAEIGKILFLSPKTVETYRSRMMQKLGLSDLASLVRYALEHGVGGKK